MTRIINGYNATRIQVEADKSDVWSPGGLAVSNGRHDIKLSDLADVSPMGLSKSGNQTGFNRSSWTPVSSWSVRAGYPTTVIIGNGIEIQQKHRGILKFNAFFEWQAFAKLNIQMRLKINGQVVRTLSYATRNCSLIYVADFEYGDLVTVEVRYESKFQFFSFPVNYLTGTLLSSSYLTIEKYDRSAQDFQFDMSYDDNSAFWFNDNVCMVGPDYGKKQPALYDVTADINSAATRVDTTQLTTMTWGPVLAQSRSPIPVDEGYVVDFSGKFLLRRFNIVQKDNPGGSNFSVRFSIWGQGTRQDEYGQNPVSQELMFYETAMPSPTSSGYFDVTIPVNTPVVIPEDIKSIYFTCVLKTTSDDNLSPANYRHVSGGMSNNLYFGWYNSQPLRIVVTPPEDQITYEHPLSQTGVAYKNRRFYDNLAEPKDLVLMGAPDAATEVLIYQYNRTSSSRGSLIGTYAVAADERKTVSVQSATGTIELDSVSTTPASINRTKAGTQAIANGWTDIIGFVSGSNVVTIAQSGIATVTCAAKFSDTNNGKQLRFLVNGQPISAWAVSGSTVTGSYKMHLNAGDQVKMKATRFFDTSVLATDTKLDIVYDSAKSDYFVESVTAQSYDTMFETQTRLDRIEWQDISDDLNNIQCVRQEFRAGKMTLKFVSDQLSSGVALAPGKRIRLLAINYGDSPTEEGVQQYQVLFTGTIRDYSIKYNYEGRPNVQVDIYDCFKELDDTDGRYFYDKPFEYAPMLHGVGRSVVVDGVEISGPVRDAPDGMKNLPSSYQENAKISETLEAVRNTNKGYVYVDRYNTLTYRSELDPVSKLSVGDSYARSDISYGKIEKGTTTEAVINVVKPEEHSLDISSLSERNVATSTPVDLEDIPSKTQLANYYYRSDSIRAYGERSETFPVVRGTGDIQDLRIADFGSSFLEWSTEILNDYDLHKNRISRVMLVPNDFYQLKQISELEILDAVRIYYKNEEHTAFIRKIEWYIQNNHIRVEIYFQREKRQSAWLPAIETVDSYTNLWFDTW